MTADIIEMPRTAFTLNSLNKLVIRAPQQFQAVVPVCHELNDSAFPDIEGVPGDQHALEEYLGAIQQPADTLIRPLRTGYLYIFRENTLYAEYRITYDDQKKLSYYAHIDFSREQGKDTRESDPDQPAAPYVLIPAEGEYQIAYSEGQWPWITVQLFGGLELEQNLPQFSIPAPQADNNLLDWNPGIARNLRKKRCHSQQPGTTPDGGLLTPLSKATHKPSPELPEAFSELLPPLAELKNHEDALEPEQQVKDWVLLPIKDPLLIGHQLLEALHQGWDALLLVMQNMQDPDHPSWEYSRYYESALIAYQVFYQRDKVAKGKTRWQQDQGSEDAFNHLSLADLEAALAINLRRVINDIIGALQNELARFMTGKDQWQGWDELLDACLNDYIPMPHMPAGQQQNEDDPATWGYAHRRWYHLDALISPLAQSPRELDKLIAQDPVSLSLADKVQHSLSKEFIRDLLRGNHSLSAHVFNAPEKAYYAFEEPLLALLDFANTLTQYDENTYTEEKALLEALFKSTPPRNSYRQDLAAQKSAQDDKHQEETSGQIKLADAAKLSIHSVRFVAKLTNSVGSAALSTAAKELHSRKLHPTFEKIRHLFNTVSRSHLRYMSFEQLLALQKDSNPETQTRLISAFLNDVESNRTEIISKTTPDQFEQNRLDELQSDQANAESDYLKQRRDLKKQLRDELIPEDIKQLNAEENHRRSHHSELRSARQSLVEKKNRLLRSYNDGNGDITAMELAAGNNREYQNTLEKLADMDNRLDFNANKLEALRTRKTHLEEQQLQWIEDYFADYKETRKSRGSEAAQALNDIEGDAPALQRLIAQDPDSPLTTLFEQDQQHKAELENLAQTAQTDISGYNQNYQSRLSEIEQQRRTPINDQAPEGRELIALRRSQQAKLASAGSRDIITSNEANFESLKNAYQNSPDHILLDPDQSALWKTQFEGNYLVLEGGEHLRAIDPSQPSLHHAISDISIHSALVIFDMLNLFNAAMTISGASSNAKSTRNILDLTSSALGTLSSVSDAWKVAHSHRAILNETQKQASVYVRVMESNRALLGGRSMARLATRLGVAAAGIGTTVAIFDMAQNLKEGDDAAFADATIAVGSAMSFVAFFAAGAVLGPLGIAVGLVGIALKAFVFTEDNLLNTWLEQGPFSEEKEGHRSRLIKEDPGYGTDHRLIRDENRQTWDSLLDTPHLKVWQTSLVSYRCGIENTLTDEKGKPLPLLHLHTPWQRTMGTLVLDQNYTVLGLDYSKNLLQYNGAKFWVEPNDNTIYLKHQGELHPIAIIGTPLAATAGAACDMIDEKINRVVTEKVSSDKSVRFSDRWWDFDDEEYTLPMKTYPVASLELLLNGLFPIKTDLKLIPLDSSGNPLKKKQVGRSNVKRYIGDEIATVRAIIEVEAPYFIEGQSALQVRITEPKSWFNWVNDISGLKLLTLRNNNASGHTLILQNPTPMKLIDANLCPGFYLSEEKKTYAAVFDITPSDIESAEMTSIDSMRLELQAWARVSLYGIDDRKSEKTIWFPWRTEQALQGEETEADGNTWSTKTSTLA